MLPVHVLAWLLVCALAATAGWLIWRGHASRYPVSRAAEQSLAARAITVDAGLPDIMTALDIPSLLQAVGNDLDLP